MMRAQLLATSSGDLTSLSDALASVQAVSIEPRVAGRAAGRRARVGARGRARQGSVDDRPGGRRARAGAGAARRPRGGAAGVGRAERRATTSGSPWSTRPTRSVGGPRGDLCGVRHDRRGRLDVLRALRHAAWAPSPRPPPAVVVAPDEPATAPVCRACGGTIADDGYCESCGEQAVSERDHWSELPSALVGGVSDRGRRKTRNEDAMALGGQRHRRPSSWSATGCRTCRTPTSRASPRRAPRGTSWSRGRRAARSARGRRSWSPPRPRPTRPSPTPSGTRPTAPSRRRARSSRRSSTARPSSRAGSGTPGCTGCRTRGPPTRSASTTPRRTR